MLKKENDAWEASLESQMLDLEYVYEIAVGTLGMVYPNHNEIIYIFVNYTYFKWHY